MARARGGGREGAIVRRPRARRTRVRPRARRSNTPPRACGAGRGTRTVAPCCRIAPPGSARGVPCGAGAGAAGPGLPPCARDAATQRSRLRSRAAPAGCAPTLRWSARCATPRGTVRARAGVRAAGAVWLARHAGARALLAPSPRTARRPRPPARSAAPHSRPFHTPGALRGATRPSRLAMATDSPLARGNAALASGDVQSAVAAFTEVWGGREAGGQGAEPSRERWPAIGGDLRPAAGPWTSRASPPCSGARGAPARLRAAARRGSARRRAPLGTQRARRTGRTLGAPPPVLLWRRGPPPPPPPARPARRAPPRCPPRLQAAAPRARPPPRRPPPRPAQALAGAPSADVHEALARAHIKGGAHLEAAEAALKAITLDAGMAKAYLRRGCAAGARPRGARAALSARARAHGALAAGAACARSAARRVARRAAAARAHATRRPCPLPPPRPAASRCSTSTSLRARWRRLRRARSCARRWRRLTRGCASATRRSMVGGGLAAGGRAAACLRRRRPGLLPRGALAQPQPQPQRAWWCAWRLGRARLPTLALAPLPARRRRGCGAPQARRLPKNHHHPCAPARGRLGGGGGSEQQRRQAAGGGGSATAAGAAAA